MIKKLIKNNKFLFFVIGIYSIMIITMPSKGFSALKNSSYYFKEMFEIMPPIFIIIGIIEAWVSREKIIKLLGERSGIRGGFLAFLLGSVSAGPIYGAFPVCKILLDKGAHVGNIVIIMSSWAVIKIPMLINETKFLGFKFMSIRWGFTILGIILMSIIIRRTIKKEDLAEFKGLESEKLVDIFKESCMGCGLCVRLAPEYFELIDNKAEIKNVDIDVNKLDKIKEIVDKCPAKAVIINSSYEKEEIEC